MSRINQSHLNPRNFIAGYWLQLYFTRKINHRSFIPQGLPNNDMDPNTLNTLMKKYRKYIMTIKRVGKRHFYPWNLQKVWLDTCWPWIDVSLCVVDSVCTSRVDIEVAKDGRGSCSNSFLQLLAMIHTTNQWREFLGLFLTSILNHILLSFLFFLFTFSWVAWRLLYVGVGVGVAAAKSKVLLWFGYMMMLLGLLFMTRLDRWPALCRESSQSFFNVKKEYSSYDNLRQLGLN
jgi:hypothetical protein